MTAADDNDGKDDDLDLMAGSMRSMWRELPEAEPPARGLAELMAAARTKAAELAPAPEKESWWRRSFALLLRPPMLAAATVVVLVGGAVVLNQRGGTEVTATATTRTQPVLDEGARDYEGKAALPTPPPSAEAAPSGAGAAAIGDGETPRPAVVRRPSRRPAVREPIARPADPPPPAEPDDFAPDPKLEIANGTDEEVEPTTAIEDTRARPPAVRPTAPTVAPTTTERPQVSTEQLIKQAESAAGRNDCPAVRVTAERIKKLDASVYKARVAKQPAIARCLK